LAKIASGANIFSIVLCGGSGTRLWPLSRRSHPKQFLKLGGTDTSLLQASIARVERLSPPAKRWIVTAKGQEQLCKEQVGSKVARILVEPQARNTSAAIAWATWELMKTDPDAYMVILSSDHSIQNVRSFERTIQDAVKLASNGYFVTVGIQPTFPSTGFGYIEVGLPLDEHAQILSAIGHAVRSFHEKPNLAAAEQFLRTGKYLWNAGLFVWQTKTFWNAFSHIQPEMAAAIEAITPENFEATYAQIESSPIDISFIEQTSHVACVPARFDWNDVGSWSAVRECFEQDAQGNSTSGDVFVSESKGCVVHSAGPFVAAIGVQDLVIIATADAILVLPTDRSQEVKKVVSYLEQNKRMGLL
jgi:mannose-1-phosphate guanylyltransferase/mannose-6-phosphate isomerase